MKRLGYLCQAVLIHLGLWLARLLPFTWRARFIGAVTGALVRYVPVLRGRVDENLAQVYPQMDRAARRAFAGQVGRNVGLSSTEILFNAEFAPIAAKTPIHGPGLAALEAAKGKGAIILSGHFGQWEAIRHALKARGLETGALYRPNNNPYFETLWRAGIEHGGRPIIAKGAAGNRALLKHLRGGGFIALLSDQYIAGGTVLTYLGQPAVTTLSPAELALRYDIPLIPAFAPRTQKGIEITIEAPIATDTPEAMMQAFNDRLGAWVARYPEQWYWLHQRWKIFPWDLPQDARQVSPLADDSG